MQYFYSTIAGIPDLLIICKTGTLRACLGTLFYCWRISKSCPLSKAHLAVKHIAKPDRRIGICAPGTLFENSLADSASLYTQVMEQRAK